jgi:hypothetical protein
MISAIQALETDTDHSKNPGRRTRIAMSGNRPLDSGRVAHRCGCAADHELCTYAADNAKAQRCSGSVANPVNHHIMKL